MQARPPPLKVILRRCVCQDCPKKGGSAYRLEYTPGMRASVTSEGKGDSQRSGLNSRTSSPQSSLLRLDGRIATTMVVPAGTGISPIELPSTQVIGSERGITMSFWALVMR